MNMSGFICRVCRSEFDDDKAICPDCGARLSIENKVNGSNINNVVRFKDGKFLGLFGKVDNLSQAIQFDGNWETEIHMKNNPIRLSEEIYEVKTVKTTWQLID
jgi:hypothetical protein